MSWASELGERDLNFNKEIRIEKSWSYTAVGHDISVGWKVLQEEEINKDTIKSQKGSNVLMYLTRSDKAGGPGNKIVYLKFSLARHFTTEVSYNAGTDVQNDAHHIHNFRCF
ncbi:hypothetical protein CEXT_291321 [Caerostris extrusa]|uniref:Uncharacterized protein n=1 Tax=Caerostris extrusa TaxID=172846 RepID=A0AAV4W3D5_CAEEX|nr:hypothetical protein CEXT_291321 [Caerostris extrusa]